MAARRREGFDTVTIADRDGELQATFAPGAGMLCCSLRHRGTELLAQQAGVRAYAERGATMGIPLLYPWANRLAGFDYPGPRGAVELKRADPLLKLDPNGLPIHGAIPGALPWELLDGDGDGDGGERADAVRARLRWERPELLAIFPWRHELEYRARVEAARLTIEAVVRAGEQATPVSFGFHPYMSLPGGERRAWELTLPVGRRLLLDDRMIPTGASEPFDRRSFTLGDGDWDDAFADLTSPPRFVARGGGVTVELELVRGYSYAQLYAPAPRDFVCFEPMTAPTNALRSGVALPLLAPGEAFHAAFAISIAAAQNPV